MYELNKEVTYNGVDYTVIQLLENELLLVVVKSDYESRKYPISTYVVPDEQVIAEITNMKKA